MAKKKTKENRPPDKTVPRRPDRDRRVRQADRMARVLRVLEFIQTRGRWTTKAIAEELECSERTVYRDLEVLAFAGVPFFKDEPQGFLRVRSDYRFPVMPLGEDEIWGQTLATVLTQAPGLDVTSGATPVTRKMAAVSQEQTQELIDDALRLMAALDLKLVDHSHHHETIRTIQSALIQRNQIVGQYESPYEPKPRKLTIHPYRLCLIKRAWYVIGRLDGESDVKTFRVARFRSIQVNSLDANIPRDFDLRKHFGNAWAVFRGDTSHDVELRFDPEAAKVVTETVWHHTQETTKHKDGRVTLSFTVDGLNEILHWILTWTGKVTIVGPEELKTRFRETLEMGLSMNH